MLAFCVRSSHEIGMGHFFRALALAECAATRGIKSLFLLNAYEPALEILRRHGRLFIPVAVEDEESDWEGEFIRRYGVSIWIDDLLETSEVHASRVRAAGAKRVTFDDTGSAQANLHVAALLPLAGTRPRGARVLAGPEFLVLNPDVARYRRHRQALGSTVVSLGGTDTHGATAGVVRILAARGRTATVVVGPGFVGAPEFERSLPPGFEMRRNVASLPAEFARHDLGVTGGGVTAFEAAAAGLPTIVIANETHEVAYARYLEGIGCSVFAGSQSAIRPETFDRQLDIPAMSRAGLEGVDALGVERILDEVLAL